MGRTGRWFAAEHEGVVPDLVTSAKALGGGLPIGAVTARADVIDAVHGGGLGGTFGGNPLACAAALATIETIEADGLLARATHLGELMTGRLTELQRADPRIGQVRGRGAMVAIEIVDPDATDAAGVAAADPGTTARVAAACHAAGLLVLTAGTYGNVLRFLPPFVISDDLMHDGLDVLGKALSGVGT